jgi:hypothetical protein
MKLISQSEIISMGYRLVGGIATFERQILLPKTAETKKMVHL